MLPGAGRRSPVALVIVSIFDPPPPFQSSSAGAPGGSTAVSDEGTRAVVSVDTRDVIEVPSAETVVSTVNTMLSPGATSAAPTHFPASAAAERLQVKDPIGEGGMGVVSAAFDALLLRRLARKVMRGPVADDPVASLRFIEEAQITAQLDHPNIVAVHDLALSDDGRLYFTMKLVDGRTLTSVFEALRRRAFASLELERVLRIFLKVCDAVAFAHARGVVHRDLKPDNVMVGSYGQVYVMDWGVALLMQGKRASADAAEPPISLAPDHTPDRPGSVLGTVAYMAPEQAHGLVEEQGPWTDVFGLGAILYDLLTGMAPNAAGTYTETLRRAKTGGVPDPTGASSRPDLPPGLCRIAMKALEPVPSHRYASVDDLKRDVEDLLRGGGWFRTRAYEAGAVILHEGAEADAAFIVTEGTCEVFRLDNGERHVVRRLGAGEIFGELGLLTRRPRVASVVATSAVRVLVISPEALDRELDRSGWLRTLVEALATRFRELDQGGRD